ncbi:MULTISPECIES: LuxR C-terminal-related transcriptional regulator [unclassified Beijerinckia]|uniref:helix-turn-helix transcriptional regulator n=1 Tax=unclassified Beijerinckia TaxID=2638183 RepID=UPI0008979EC7|nr:MULTISPECIES: LuxR C-terminal-related transcriptional regulator [unclassified Beijerinckia]MDH7795348.1 DNA-binding CsgD family transcriptional regulator/PAS domain-containing protein [Beijerinckia sp. GAS462]SEB97754.1 DNA-binding transcriptional regulator, CsgD family [Beijerinckia sp. 28-YEA-48]
MGYSISHETLSAAIGRIYDAAYDPSVWLDAILQLQATFHGSKACLVNMDLGRFEDSIFFSPGSDPSWNALLPVQFPINELIMPRTSMPIGRVFGDAQLLGRDRLQGTAIWNEWMAPQDMYDGMGCNLQMSGKRFAFFDVQRGRDQPVFDVDDHAMLALVAPHLQRATRLSEHFKARQASRSLFAHLPFAGFVLDTRLRILEMNAAAQTLLSQPICALTARAGHLAACDPAQTNTLLQVVGRVCRVHEGELPGLGADLIVRAERGDQLALSIGLLPSGGMFGLSAGPCAVVLARESKSAFSPVLHDQLRETFGLTAKEASIALSLASGLSLKETAIKENIVFGTARIHLERIFRKTETRQQSQLVALLNSIRFLA